MMDWIKNIKFSKILWATLSYAIIATVLHQIESIFTMNFYLLESYFGTWSKFMMSKAGPPEPIFYILSMLFSLISGFLIASVYYFLKDHLTQDYWKKVISFSLLLFIISIVTFTLPCILLFHLPIGLVLSWILTSIFIYFFGSMVFVKIIG